MRKWKKKLATIAVLSALASVAIYIINKLFYFIATVDNLLHDTESNYYQWRFGKIYYTKQGDGSPILLVHDLNSSSSGYEWHKLTEKLSRTNTVYTIDLLGCGRSDKPNLTYTNFLYVQLITDFIKHVVGSKTDVVATGESGAFILMACKNDASIIDHIMMIHPESLSNLASIPTKETKALRFMFMIPVVGTLLYNILTTKKSIERSFFTEYFYNISNVSENDIKAYFEAAHTGDIKPKYLMASIKGLYTKANIIHCLKELNNSIFILTSSEMIDKQTDAEQYKAYAPSIEIVCLDRVKKLPQMERPDSVLEQIQILFNDCTDWVDSDTDN